MEGAVQKIPEVLVYEMVDGNPIYYKGYKDYLNGVKQLEELIGSSKLQSLIITKLIILLHQFFGDEYLIFTNEIGIQFSKNSWRSADIAVVNPAVKTNIDNKYIDVAPEVVIEIDTKAELHEVQNPLGYYQEKTDELIAFGVGKVIWIFTDTEKIMIAQKGQPWTIANWNEKIEVQEGFFIDIASLVPKS